MAFDVLNLAPQLLGTLNELGYREPTPIQAQAIPAVLEGHDVLAGAQTGTGKTAAFSLPLIHKLMGSEPVETEGGRRLVRALVLVPTRELAKQVHDSFVLYGKDTGLQCAMAYGGACIATQVKAIKQADVVIATPGRLLDHLRKKVLNFSALQYLVFDEADRMLDMGFKDEIRDVLRQIPNKCQTLLFSATLSDAIYRFAKNLLASPKRIEVAKPNTAAAKIEQRIYAVDSDSKASMVCHLINASDWHQVLIFSRTKQGADKLAETMNKAGIATKAFHGDLSQKVRETVLKEFSEGDVRVLVATDVAARGLDIEDLNYVINMELPHIAEDYVHRIGRTGRAGKDGTAVTLFSNDDALRLEEVETLLDTRLAQQWYPALSRI